MRDFVDQYISCSIAEDTELAQIVRKVQKHRYSSTCRRNGQCRFHHPRPHTMVAHEFPYEMCSTEEAEEAKAAQAALSTLRKTLDDKDTPDDISLDDLLKKAKVSYETYIEGLQICCRSKCEESQLNHR